MDVRAGTAGVTLTEFSDLACHLPLESATERAIDPEWWVSPELQMLRDISYSANVLKWQPTEDGRRGRNQPKPTLLTSAERSAAMDGRGDAALDVMSIEEAAEMLGWPA